VIVMKLVKFRVWSLWFICGAIVGGACLTGALAAIPRSGVLLTPDQVTDDRNLYEKLKEIDLKKVQKPRADLGLGDLARREGSYRESLPSLYGRPSTRRVRRQVYRFGKNR